MCHHGCADRGPLDPRADPDDLACGLDAEGQRRDASDVPTAGANELFPVPDAGSLDLDQHLPGFQRRRLRQLEKRDVVAERLDAGGSQAHARIIARSGSPRLAADGRDKGPAARPAAPAACASSTWTATGKATSPATAASNAPSSSTRSAPTVTGNASSDERTSSTDSSARTSRSRD